MEKQDESSKKPFSIIKNNVPGPGCEEFPCSTLIFIMLNCIKYHRSTDYKFALEFTNCFEFKDIAVRVSSEEEGKFAVICTKYTKAPIERRNFLSNLENAFSIATYYFATVKVQNGMKINVSEYALHTNGEPDDEVKDLLTLDSNKSDTFKLLKDENTKVYKLKGKSNAPNVQQDKLKIAINRYVVNCVTQAFKRIHVKIEGAKLVELDEKCSANTLTYSEVVNMFKTVIDTKRYSRYQNVINDAISNLTGLANVESFHSLQHFKQFCDSFRLSFGYPDMEAWRAANYKLLKFAEPRLEGADEADLDLLYNEIIRRFYTWIQGQKHNLNCHFMDVKGLTKIIVGKAKFYL